MKSIIESLKNKQILISVILMFLFQLFIGVSVMIVLLFRNDIFVIGTNDNTQGIIVFVIATVIGLIFSLVILMLSLSRLRTLTLILLVSIPSIIVFLLSVFTPLNTIYMSPLSGAIIGASIWIGYFIFGLSTFTYFKLKNVYLTICILGFWHLGVMALTISDEINTSSEVTYSNAFSKIGVIADPLYISLMAGFLIFAMILVLVDSKINISRWRRNLREETKLGAKNLGVFGVLFLITLICTLALAPLFWRLNWYQREKAQKGSQEQQEQEERKKPPQQGNGERQPKNGEQFDSGSSLENKYQSPEGKPMFVVKLGESDVETAAFEIKRTQTEVELLPNWGNQEDKYEKEEVKYLWRASVFDGFSNTQGFFTKNYLNITESTFNKQLGYYFTGDERRYEKTELLEQKYQLLDTQSFQIFGANRAFEMNYLSNENIPYIFGFTNGNLITDEKVPLQQGSTYYLASELPTATETDLKNAYSQIIYDKENYFTAYLFSRNQQIFSKVSEITKGLKSDYEKAKAIENYLKANYEYERAAESLPAEKLKEKDIVDFILTTKKGDVSHFNAAYVMMLDYLYIDARIAVGFLQGTYDETLKSYVIYDNDFFMWTEIYFTNTGWVNFNPLGEASEEEKQRQEQENQEQKELSEEEQEEIEDNFEEFDQEKENLYENREEWFEENDTPYNNWDEDIDEWDQFEDVPKNPEVPNTPIPTPKPKPETKSNEALKNFFTALWNIIKSIWWVCCGLLIIISITTPPILKQYKIMRRRGLFANRSDKEQINETFLLLQDTLKDFGEQLKFPETSLKFAERFANSFPLEFKSEETKKELIKIAQIYNRSHFAKDILKGDLVEIENSVDFVISVYLQTKGIKAVLRWFNPFTL